LTDAELDPAEKYDRLPQTGGFAGKIRIIRENGSIEKAGYQTNFSLARFDEKLFKTLDYKNTDISDFEASVDVLPGIYRLLSGVRRNDGSVMVRSVIFRVEPGESKCVVLRFRKDEEGLPVIGRVPENITFTLIEGSKKTVTKLSPFGTALMWIDPEREPSKHLIRELRELSQEVGRLKGRLIICIGDDKYVNGSENTVAVDLPGNIGICRDDRYECLNIVDHNSAGSARTDLPAVYVVDGNSMIRYASFGYRLGKGTEIIKTLGAIEKNRGENDG